MFKKDLPRVATLSPVVRRQHEIPQHISELIQLSEQTNCARTEANYPRVPEAARTTGQMPSPVLGSCHAWVAKWLACLLGQIPQSGDPQIPLLQASTSIRALHRGEEVLCLCYCSFLQPTPNPFPGANLPSIRDWEILHDLVPKLI